MPHDVSTSIGRLQKLWLKASAPPKIELTNRIGLFEVGTIARYSVSKQELTRDDSAHIQVRGLVSGSTKSVANPKLTSVVFLSFVRRRQKTLIVTSPNLIVSTVKKPENVAVCKGYFEPKKNRLNQKLIILSQNQGKIGAPQHFQNTLNGLAAQCEFFTQTKILVYDKFLIKMANVTVQE